MGLRQWQGSGGQKNTRRPVLAGPARMPRKKTLKLATFNVNGINSRLPHLLGWLDREKPDIVALQELKATDQGFPADALEKAGYGAIWQGQSSWNGVALLGRNT